MNLKKFFRRFFLNYIWIGLIIILITIIIDLKYNNLNFIYEVLLEFFKTAGISILVASIFTWASESYAFVDKIQQLLKSVVVKRDFLANLDSVSKIDALKSIIKPNAFEKKTYANIEDYYDYYIKQTMEMASKNVRSQYIINATIYEDVDDNILVCSQIVNYRLYPNVSGYEAIRIGFTESSNESKIIHVRIFESNGEKVEILGEEIQLVEKEFDGEKARIASINLSKYSVEKHLDIEIKTIDYGHDHWISPSIQALQPTDGLTYRIKCEDGIQINSHDTFSQGIDFNVDENLEKNEITISTYQWIHEGTGISIIASKH